MDDYDVLEDMLRFWSDVAALLEAAGVGQGLLVAAGGGVAGLPRVLVMVLLVSLVEQVRG